MESRENNLSDRPRYRAIERQPATIFAVDIGAWATIDDSSRRTARSALHSDASSGGPRERARSRGRDLVRSADPDTERFRFFVTARAPPTPPPYSLKQYNITIIQNILYYCNVVLF